MEACTPLNAFKAADFFILQRCVNLSLLASTDIDDLKVFPLFIQLLLEGLS